MYAKKKNWFKNQRTSIVPSGLVAYYRFNGNSNDEIGVNNGIDTGVTYITGNSGDCVAIGSGQKVDLGNPLLIGGNRGSFSISFWILNASISRIFGSWVSPNRGIILDIDVGKLRTYLMLDGVQYGCLQLADPSFWVSGTGWHNVILTYDGSIIKHYVDGILQPTTTLATGSTYATLTQNEQFGIWGVANGGVNGLDSCGFWHRALTHIEAEDVYNIGLSGNELI